MTNAKTPTRSTRKPANPVKTFASKRVPRQTEVATRAKRQTAKPVVTTEAAPVAAPAKQKNKLVRDGFTIPKSEYNVLAGLKLRAAMLTRPTKKSEILRAGIAALNAMNDKQFLAAVIAVPSLKTGRPKTEATKSSLSK